MAGRFIALPLAFVIGSLVAYWAVFINTRKKAATKKWEMLIDIVVMVPLGLIVVYLLVSWLVLSLLGSP